MAKSRRLPVRLKVAFVSPVNGRAMTRPDHHGRRQLECHFTDVVEPLQAEVFLAGRNLENRIDRGVADGLPVRICSSPNSWMIGTPDACLSPRIPGRLAFLMSASVSAGGNVGTVWGNYPHANGTVTPAISQWPDGVSLPLHTSRATPQRPPVG